MSFPPDLSPASPAPFEDRRTGLTIFGVLTLMIGIVFALFVPLMFATLALGPHAGVPAQDMRQILPPVFIYGGLAVVFIWLGIGSIKARRWARALLLIISWAALLIGVIATVVMAVVMPNSMALVPPGQPAPPAEVKSFMVVFTVVFMVVFLVILPAIWVFFYRSRHVKATCEAVDPVERWTDRSPLPVIAVSLWLVFTVPSILIMPLAYNSVIPLFGTFLVGPAAAAIYFLLAALWLYGAWAMYKLRPLGWWIVTVSFAVFALSGFLTYSRHSIGELYRLMGYPDAQLALLEQLDFMTGSGPAWMMAATFLPILCYMLYVRKYFAQAAAT